jgi:hypothetical protein
VALDLDPLSVRELLALNAATVESLKQRGVLRTRNAPLGDYVEWLAVKALGGELAPNSERSFDYTSPGGNRVQVKARAVGSPPARGELQTSPFRTWGFEEALLVQLDRWTFEVVRASVLPVSVVESMATYRRHVNGWIVFMTDALMGHAGAVDVTAALRQASQD